MFVPDTFDTKAEVPIAVFVEPEPPPRPIVTLSKDHGFVAVPFPEESMVRRVFAPFVAKIN